MNVHFHKYHALGNDYIVIDPGDSRIALTPDAIRVICDRHRGVDSDGILLGPIIENDKIRLRIFNPDGSEAVDMGTVTFRSTDIPVAGPERCRGKIVV